MKTTSNNPEFTALPRLMDQRELADYLGKSVAWCERARWAGEGPTFLKLGRHVRYRVSDVMAWVEASARTSTNENGNVAKLEANK